MDVLKAKHALFKMELGTIQAVLYHFDTPCGLRCGEKKIKKNNAYVW